MDQKREHGDQQRGDHKPILFATQNLEADCKEYRKTQCVHPLTGYLKLNAIIGGFVCTHAYINICMGFVLSRFYIQDDFQSILHEIVRTGLVGAVFGAAVGGWMNDCLGRRISILTADALVFIGGVFLMLLLSISDSASCSDCCLVTTGKTFIALGIVTVSMTSPIYISEVSPPKSRDTLVSSNYYLFAFGKFIFLCADSYLTAFSTSQDPIGSTDYIIALAGFPALLQFVLMLSLPDSPIWLYKRNREEDAIEALRKIYNFCEVEKEFDALRLSVTNETAGQDEKNYSVNSILSKIRTAWSSPLVRKQFVISNGLQVAQQLIGETGIIYCIPSIARMGSLASPNPDWDIWFMKFTYWIYYGVMALPGGIVGSYILVSRFGRRRVLLFNIYCVLWGLLGICFIYIISPNNIEGVSRLETIANFGNNTCSSYIEATNADRWDCLTCLRAGCGFCAGINDNFMLTPGGACLTAEPNGTSQACFAKNRIWLTQECRMKAPAVATFYFSAVCHVSYSVMLGTIPWIINLKIYPAEVRGIYGGMAATTNWISFLSVIVLFFLLNKAIGSLFTIIFISLISVIVIQLIKMLIPEYKGFFLSEEVGRKST
ncbi:hypothetical protein MKX03_014063 [Papaver bracteatum]|nr:hypothetical protein MKX03_014063 [Papaver bracteatum]